ncbi:hypothetical protein EES40_35995 [Streptomyces sp. ADI93-02]|nr:hypothetical protein EES40_35995 [Streptomyces sp. ADI93-02]
MGAAGAATATAEHVLALSGTEHLHGCTEKGRFQVGHRDGDGTTKPLYPDYAVDRGSLRVTGSTGYRRPNARITVWLMLLPFVSSAVVRRLVKAARRGASSCAVQPSPDLRSDARRHVAPSS